MPRDHPPSATPSVTPSRTNNNVEHCTAMAPLSGAEGITTSDVW